MRTLLTTVTILACSAMFRRGSDSSRARKTRLSRVFRIENYRSSFSCLCSEIVSANFGRHSGFRYRVVKIVHLYVLHENKVLFEIFWYNSPSCVAAAEKAVIGPASTASISGGFAYVILVRRRRPLRTANR